MARVQLLTKDQYLREQFASRSRSVALQTTWDKINNRVAWYLADTIQCEERRKVPMRTFERSLFNWIYALLCTMWVELKFTGAMAIVTFFWIVAVFPILIHGNIVFAAKKPVTKAP